MKLIRKNSKAGKKTFIYFQYGGHAFLDNVGNIEALCNIEVPCDEDDCYQRFPLDSHLLNLAKLTNVYILAVLNCGREAIPTRGGGQKNFGCPEPGNLITIYSCRRGRICRGDSSLSQDVFSKLRSMVKAD